MSRTGLPKSDVPPARAASAICLCESISDETVPPARAASAICLRESISDETEPPARTASANGLRESISDETEPSARAALASGLRESISEEIVPEARHSRVTRYATQERAGTVHLQAVSVPEVRYCFTCKCSVFVEVIQIIGNIVLFK